MARETTDLALVLAIIAAVFIAVKAIFSSPVTTALENGAANALTGQLTDSQKQSLIDQETQNLIQAGSEPASAKAQATLDVNQATSSQPTSYFDALGTVLEHPIDSLESIL